MKKHGVTILLIMIFVVGLSLLLYPTIADYWNSFHQSSAIASYIGEVAEMDDDVYREIWDSANKYNEKIAKYGNLWVPNKEQLKEYNKQLDVSKTGIMGYVDIPAIDCKLPIYHGTDEAVLQIAVGHIEGSSLPVGGPSTHCVLSGHRGLPSAKLFTNIDKLSEGDRFMIQVLDETLTYEIKKILIVKPHEIDALKIEEGKDLCTLVTCTPYGINSHRILVKGTRVETEEEEQGARVTADAVQVEPLAVALVVGVFLILLLWILLLISIRKRKRAKKYE